MRRIVTIGIMLVILFLFVAPVFAQTPEETPTSLIQGLETCIATGNCTLCDAFRVALNIMKWILGTAGGLALFFVIDGGFALLTSGGNTEKIEGGKKKVVGSILGIIIVAGAWTLVTVIILVFATPTDAPVGQFKGVFGAANPASWSQIKCQ